MSGPPAQTTHLQLGDEIGRGALGRVVEVRDPDTGAVFAGKILHRSHLADPSALSRFEAEAAIAADLHHPNLVAIDGIVTIGGERVLLMELVRGPSLAEVIAREGALPTERLIAIARGIADGLSAAHRSGLVHRDLKPHNVLLAGGEVPKIVDFGLARAASFEGVDPSSFAVVGTPDYIAPESIDPLAVDPRSDLYSLGCILFEMATGAPPFSGATAFALLEAHRRTEPPPLPDKPPRPPRLRALIGALLAKSPADRPQSARIVEEELADIARAGGTELVRADGTELVRAGDADFARTGGRCAGCGERLVAAIPVCFGCGMEQARLARGHHTLFIVGPGATGDKLSSELRRRLLDWLRDSPGLGLDAAPLARRMPRLPFALVSRVSESSAEDLAESLGALGFVCRVQRGGRYALAEARQKAWMLSRRLGGIMVLTSFYIWQWQQPALMWSVLLGGVGGGMVGGWALAGRRWTSRRRQAGVDLPPALAGAAERVAGVLPAIRGKRHREGLRAVVERALALRERVATAATPELAEASGADLDADLARVLDRATVAASRIDELETRLLSADLRDPDPDTRAAMRERDLCAAQLLELAALLDSLRVRLAAAAVPGAARGAPAGDAAAPPADLDELRAYVEALEEVREL